VQQASSPLSSTTSDCKLDPFLSKESFSQFCTLMKHSQSNLMSAQQALTYDPGIVTTHQISLSVFGCHVLLEFGLGI
jgi:hypothetical protein